VYGEKNFPLQTFPRTSLTAVSESNSNQLYTRLAINGLTVYTVYPFVHDCDFYTVIIWHRYMISDSPTVYIALLYYRTAIPIAKSEFIKRQTIVHITLHETARTIIIIIIIIITVDLKRVQSIKG